MLLELASSFVAVLLLFTVGLALNVSYGRMRHRHPHGEGPSRELARASRAHKNSVEHSVPIAVLLVCYALLQGDAAVIAALGAAAVTARVSLTVGILRKGAFSARRFGAYATYLVEGVLCVLVLLRAGARTF
jgi:uncharacterized membrane protein YecN with MAPEG domain